MTDKKRGRPRTDTPGARVTTWVSSPEYQKILDLARRDHKSLSATVRALMALDTKKTNFTS